MFCFVKNAHKEILMKVNLFRILQRGEEFYSLLDRLAPLIFSLVEEDSLYC